MRGALAARWWGTVFVLAAVALAGPAQAFEFFEGRLRVNGFYEAQLRSLVQDYEFDDDIDLAQWYNVLNIEAEADIAPYGWGPFNLVTGFARVEVRYDCVWNHGCGISPSIDTYGNDAQRLPKRLLNGRRSGLTGTVFTNDVGSREYRRIKMTGPGTRLGLFNDTLPASSRRPLRLEEVPPFTALAGVRGPDGMINTADDPFPAVGDIYRDCRFGVENTKGTTGGVGADVLPTNPGCEIDPTAPLAGIPNPFRAGDFNPRIASGGSAELPARPAPIVGNTVDATPDQARGIWYPNPGLREQLGDFDNFDQNFREEELQWNRGAAQQDEKELKELYLDIEMFDSRLWLRLGKQNIVWGKTELFRTTDQFNPQDLALASLPSLEESRIPLWAVRGVWSFYEVGPFSDVRLELAANIDQVEPSDLGRCGEPFTARAVCSLTFGLMAHGIAQNGLAGMDKPQDPWNSFKGYEVGARLEWRWDRFSFALIDFWGYNDTPYLDRIFTYERNVDPATGRPRVAGSRGDCVTGSEEACLVQNGLSTAQQRQRSLEQQSVNQQSFAFVCATSIGFSNLDPTVCAQSVFNSQSPAGLGSVTIATALSNVLAGQAPLADTVFPALASGLASTPYNGAAVAARTAGTTGRPTPLVATHTNPATDGPPDPTLAGSPDPFANAAAATGLNPNLTDAQEALLGCGTFYGTSCDVDGIDLLNAEASAFMQSFPGFEGTGTVANGFAENFSTLDASVVQPGTVGHPGFAVVCARNEPGKPGKVVGCRGPGDPDYDPAQDGIVVVAGTDGVLGTTDDMIHPFTGQQFSSEMAVVSWNALMGLAAFSGAAPTDTNGDGFPQNDENGDGVIDTDVFDPSNPFRMGGCSFAQPQFCSSIQALFTVTGVQRSTVEAAGNGRFGRRDFTWQGGGNAALRFQKRNVLGFSMDFAEDWTKSNWSVEFTWIDDLFQSNNDDFDGISPSDQYNLTISVDRPTFISFLNAGRTFFINSQWFFQYEDDFDDGFTKNGPVNVLATLTVQTGYFQDRLLPGITTVYDFNSNSGAVLPQVTYRFTENFSATFGVNAFFGRLQAKDAPLNPLSLPNRAGPEGDNAFVENGLSVVRERDEVFARVRMTF